jgi:L-threonylcarbamoyladenylate synthase
MKNVVKVNSESPARDVIQRAARVLQEGGLVAFPTETVYGLGANALDVAAVRRIFAAKDRPGWDPLIVHVRDVGMACSLAKELPSVFESLTQRFWPGPLTLVVRKMEAVPDEATARRSTVGLRMPRHPVASALLAAARLPIAAPSANRFGRPSPTNAEHVIEDLGDRVDLILDAGPTPMGVESTVLDLTQTPPAILRPGGISREELESLLGRVTLGTNVSDELAAQGLAGPGMTTKHYAPRAKVELLEGDVKTQASRLERRFAELSAQGKKVEVLINRGDSDCLARTLYAQFRDMDARGVDVILCSLPPPEGIGLAVCDRLRRAAGMGLVGQPGSVPRR